VQYFQSQSFILVQAKGNEFSTATAIQCIHSGQVKYERNDMHIKISIQHSMCEHDVKTHTPCKLAPGYDNILKYRNAHIYIAYTNNCINKQQIIKLLTTK
jgi:hypothetical protein